MGSEILSLEVAQIGHWTVNALLLPFGEIKPTSGNISASTGAVILKNFLKSSGLLKTGSGNSYKNNRLSGNTQLHFADLPPSQHGCRNHKATFMDPPLQKPVQSGSV